MNKHTPGPWMVDRTCGGLAIESAAHGNIGIVNLARGSKADAALIAAAPELLEWVAVLADQCAECGGMGTLWTNPQDPQDAKEYPCPQCASIRAVIDKAEGLCS